MEEGMNLGQLVNVSQGIILGFDVTMHIVFASREARDVFGSKDALIGVSYTRIFPKLVEKNITIKELVMAGDNGARTSAYRMNGTCFDVEVYTRKFSDPDYALENGYLSLKDQSDEESLFRLNGIAYMMRIVDVEDYASLNKMIETATLENEELKANNYEFVAKLTHELRTPVNGIKGQITSMKDDTNLTEDQKNKLRMSYKSCENMSGIINDILDFSKIGSEGFTLEYGKFSIREVVGRVIAMSEKMIGAKDLKIYYGVNEDVPDELYGDERRFEQILNNFISNAVKYTDDGFARLDVTLVEKNNRDVLLKVTVTDTGIGIAKEDVVRIFDSYYRVSSAVAKKEGTGLGLAITKNLVEKMDGKVHVDSEIGKGSVFSATVRLRLDEEQKEEKEEVANNKRDMKLASVPREMLNIPPWGSVKSRNKLKGYMDKLLMCIELGSWEFAENFATKIKNYSYEAPKELQKPVFDMLMAVRRGNYDQAIEKYLGCLKLLNNTEAGLTEEGR